MHTFQLTFRVVFAVALSLVILGGFSACADEGFISSPDEVIFPDTNVSYSRHVQPLFNVTCNFSGCHSTESRAGNLVLTSHFDITIRPGMVIEGQPDRSLLVQVVRGLSPHSAAFQARINQNHKDGIAQWVLEGARPE